MQRTNTGFRIQRLAAGAVSSPGENCNCPFVDSDDAVSLERHVTSPVASPRWRTIQTRMHYLGACEATPRTYISRPTSVLIGSSGTFRPTPRRFVINSYYRYVLSAVRSNFLPYFRSCSIQISGIWGATPL